MQTGGEALRESHDVRPSHMLMTSMHAHILRLGYEGCGRLLGGCTWLYHVAEKAP